MHPCCLSQGSSVIVPMAETGLEAGWNNVDLSQLTTWTSVLMLEALALRDISVWTNIMQSVIIILI